MMRKFLIILGVMSLSLALSIGVAACGDDDDEGGGIGGGADVEVTLLEFEVAASPASAPAGAVNFSVENIGSETHEFVVIKTDLAPESLPTAADGSVDETGTGIEVIDEIEDMDPDDSAELSTDLTAGSYVLVCNIVEEEDGEHESHYQEGMRLAFEVTP
jgi:uncharacterized cupredoxin-like copper-binding protein